MSLLQIAIFPELKFFKTKVLQQDIVKWADTYFITFSVVKSADSYLIMLTKVNKYMYLMLLSRQEPETTDLQGISLVHVRFLLVDMSSDDVLLRLFVSLTFFFCTGQVGNACLANSIKAHVGNLNF